MVVLLEHGFDRVVSVSILSSRDCYEVMGDEWPLSSASKHVLAASTSQSQLLQSQLTTWRGAMLMAFGVEKDLKQAWRWMMKSARLRNPKAQVQAYRLYQALFVGQDLPSETRQEMVEWPAESCPSWFFRGRTRPPRRGSIPVRKCERCVGETLLPT